MSLADAVEARMESEVPLGFLLSGGIDSASVFALGAQALGGPAHAFTVGFDEEEAVAPLRAAGATDAGAGAALRPHGAAPVASGLVPGGPARRSLTHPDLARPLLSDPIPDRAESAPVFQA